MTSNKGAFKCIHCGDRFNLDKDEMEAYGEGYFTYEPDCCDECMDMVNYPCHDVSDLHSDADPGL